MAAKTDTRAVLCGEGLQAVPERRWGQPILMQPLPTDLSIHHIWRQSPMTAMRTPFIIESDPFADPRSGFSAIFKRMEIYAFIFEGTPEPFNHDVITPASATIHGNTNGLCFQHIGKGHAGKLAALIGIEYLRPAMLCQGFFKPMQKSTSIVDDSR